MLTKMTAKTTSSATPREISPGADGRRGRRMDLLVVFLQLWAEQDARTFFKNLPEEIRSHQPAAQDGKMLGWTFVFPLLDSRRTREELLASCRSDPVLFSRALIG